MQATTAPVTRSQLDWLCIAHRALEAAPTNDTLWVEAVKAQQAIIEAANAFLPESDAAEVQALAGRLAYFATETATLTGIGAVTIAERSERLKTDILAAFTGS